MRARSTKGEDKVIMEAGFAARRYGRATSHRRAASLLVVAAVSCALPLLSGCARTQPAAAFGLTLELDKAVYQPGERVDATVRLTNLTGQGQPLMYPFVSPSRGESNTGFTLSRKDAPATLLSRAPVFPKQGAQFQWITLTASQETIRTFVFVNLTKEEGAYVLQARYTPLPVAQGMAVAPVFSPPVEFKVSGPRLWKRDADGVLLQEEAIRAARQAYGRPVRACGAVLMENSAGLAEWRVTLERDSADTKAGKNPSVSYVVNPYTCRVSEGSVPSE